MGCVMKRYPKYRESGVDWIGEVPEHWDIKPICRVTSCNDDALSENTPADSVIRYVDISAVNYAEGITDAVTVRFSDAPSRARRQARVGDVVVSTVRTYLKAIAAVTEGYANCIYSTGFAVLRAQRQKIEPDFLKWMTLNERLIQAIEAHSEGLSYPAINSTELVKLKVVVPPVVEQSFISVVLDRETARIDSLIAKKTRFIELLKEKRQALITHAVTKGLNPREKMKDSGVEWIGVVPAHWGIKSLKRLANKAGAHFADGDWIESKNLADSGIRYITTGNVGDGLYREQGSGYISEGTFRELNCTEVLPGDILISRLNPPIGRACIVPDLGMRIVTSVDNVILRPTIDYSREFLVFRFSASDYFHEVSLIASGATMQRVSRTELGNVRLALPPLDEQVAIARVLKLETSRIDSLIATTRRSIDLLKERRAAFITAAVTGQIDLREAS